MILIFNASLGNSNILFSYLTLRACMLLCLQQHQQQRHGSRDLNKNEPSVKAKTSQQTLESVVGNGWGPVPISQGSSPDPMLQQIDIIKGYITQAKQQRKLDEVDMLERNLMELEEEYIRQHQGR